ncbi:MAG: DUF4111 domain-containing protein [Firmicutes bacterium]|nr:DUF4111 domain-containing protein [Bacillota bacterium]
MEQSINTMVNRITNILNNNNPSIFLFGSIVLDDFKLGWSDIDLICLTDKPIQSQQADELVNLRQTLLSEHEGNPYFRLFEGGLLTLDAFLQNAEDTVIYWGTSGQQITNTYQLCPFSTIELLENGRLLYGDDFRQLISFPTREEVIKAIKSHYDTIRQHGKSGGGWLLDIARCLYTLRTNKIIAKTNAGEWAINENICPDTTIMEKVVQIRKNPLELRCDDKIQRWEKSLGQHIQRFADVLEVELDRCL